MIKIYLSAMRNGYDNIVAEQFYNGFRHINNVFIWYSEKDILAGQNNKITAGKIIKSSDYFLALISEYSLKSGFHIWEQRMALNKMDEMVNEIFAIPVWIGKPERYKEFKNQNPLNELYHINLFPDWEKALYKIFQTMGIAVPEEMSIPQIETT